ncbi:MAG: DMT family transporter [Acidimicrobiia bacterium]|nr:DMT family transporter [Acidimicrobiia bacterium]
MSELARQARRGAGLAAGGMLLISLDSLGIRLSGASSWDAAFWLGVFGALGMGALALGRRRARSAPAPAGSTWSRAAPTVAAGCLQAASTTFFVLAIGATTVADTVAIIAAAPVVAAVGARLALGERVRRRTAVGIALCAAGVGLIVGGSLGAGRLAGDVAALAAITAFGANVTLWRSRPDHDWTAALALGGVLMALAAATVADPGAVSGRGVLILAALGGISGAAGRLALAVASRHLAAAQVGLFAPVETVAASGWAWLFLAEAPPATTVAGGLVVLGSVAWGTSGTG